jgi:hypothetical protein
MWLQDGGSNFWPFLGPISFSIPFLVSLMDLMKKLEYFGDP